MYLEFKVRLDIIESNKIIMRVLSFKDRLKVVKHSKVVAMLRYFEMSNHFKLVKVIIKLFIIVMVKSNAIRLMFNLMVIIYYFQLRYE